MFMAIKSLDGELYYQCHRKRDEQQHHLAKVVCTPHEANNIFHASAIGAHCGVDKTMHAILQRYDWSVMKADITKWVSTLFLHISMDLMEIFTHFISECLNCFALLDSRCDDCQKKRASIKDEIQYKSIEVNDLIKLNMFNIEVVGTTCGPQFTTCFKTPRNLSPGGFPPKV